jgi:hypothetical protein
METMPTELISALAYLASQAGAGAAASILFANLRDAFPPPPQRPRSRVLAWLYALLHKPRYALHTSTLLSLLIGVAAAVILAYVQGDDWIQAAWGFAGALVSQLWYRHGRMATDVPDWKEPDA